ncbi:hypothetical protein [Streptomyces sp. NPDC060077]|uniref:hypothetical protein n=1 Tax=Streptomyces sp. NPDC060077 TaxID=3347052 RepID=UPI00366862B1
MAGRGLTAATHLVRRGLLAPRPVAVGSAGRPALIRSLDTRPVAGRTRGAPRTSGRRPGARRSPALHGIGPAALEGPGVPRRMRLRREA